MPTVSTDPDNWHAELEAFQPEVLFIESAWRGKDELWGSKVGHCSQELQSIVAWCRDRHIPTMFWNKEDPVHFETFLTTAQLFDFVFTTDMDCIHRYKAALGHEHVYFLPFACQPAVHNPIEKYERKDAFCFAGAYYVRYPERTRDLESFVKELPVHRPLKSTIVTTARTIPIISSRSNISLTLLALCRLARLTRPIRAIAMRSISIPSNNRRPCLPAVSMSCWGPIP